MASGHIYEAQRLLRRANEINAESTALAIEAIQKLAEAHIVATPALYYIYQAVPAGKKQKELLSA